jgi:tetratricopeptide (TPR) repeat protein
MLLAQWLRWRSGLLALLLSGQQPSPLPPTLAQVRQAFTAAHPPLHFACPNATSYVTLTSPHPVLACLVGDDDLTLQDGRRTTPLTLAPQAGSYLHFAVTLGDKPAGTYHVCAESQEVVTCFDLVLSGTQATAALGGRRAARFVALDDSVAFLAQMRRTLAGEDLPAPALSTLNDTGYLLQRAGYSHAALRLLTVVVQHAPERAVAYLNRGDTYWQLNQPAAAQADYGRYLRLLRTQHKDTSRVPAYVHLALRLPAR